MSRVFKFRAWDSEHPDGPGTMVYFGKDGHLNLNSYVELSNHKDHHDVLMQWTGFVDSEGKDIYEGDVVYDSFYECHFAITWISGRGRFEKIDIDSEHRDYDEPMSRSNQEDVKVVGNIYEQPELLNEESDE